MKDRYLRAALVLLIVVTGFVYLPVRDFRFFTAYDDGLYVVENDHVRSGLTAAGASWAFANFDAYNWHPLTWLSHMTDVALFGMEPGAHHAVNVVLHLVNSALLAFVLARMTRRPWPSLAVAALFALHPLHVESVAWVAERKDVLSALFLLLALHAYLRYCERPGAVRYLAVAVFFLLGLLSKPMIVTLPFILLLLDYWPLGRFEASAGVTPAEARFPPTTPGRLVLEKVPLLALSAASCIVTFIAQGRHGLVRTVAEFPLDTRVANAVVSYASYVGQTLWPLRLAVFYPHPALSDPLTTWAIVGSAVLLLAVTAAAWALRRRRPYLLAGWLFFLGTLVPVIGLVQVGEQAMADRYTYIPLIGLFTMGVWAIADIVPAAAYRRLALFSLAALVMVCLAFLARRQVETWRDNFTLFDHARKTTKDNWLAYNVLGMELWGSGNAGEALEHFQEAARIYPRYSDAFFNQGVAYFSLGSLDNAIACLSEAIRIGPASADACYNLGLAYERKGMIPEAAGMYREALRLAPEHGDARNALGGITEGGEAQAAPGVRTDPAISVPRSRSR